MRTSVLVEWLTALLRIQEVPASAWRPVIRLRFVAFSVLPGEYRDSTLKLGDDRFLPNPFQFITHLSSFHSTLYRLALVTENA
jgi:hypothetical protein